MYFGYREKHSNTTPQISNYLFHNIGLLTFNLPLFTAPTSVPTPSPSPTKTPIPTPTPNPGDLNMDGKVDTTDIRIVLSGYITKYNLIDFKKVLENFGK